MIFFSFLFSGLSSQNNLYDPGYLGNESYNSATFANQPRQIYPVQNNYSDRPYSASSPTVSSPYQGTNNLNPYLQPTQPVAAQRNYTISRFFDKGMNIVGQLGMLPFLLPILARKRV